MVNNPKRIVNRLRNDKNVIGLTASLRAMEREFADEKSVLFSTKCIDYKSLFYVLDQNGWESQGKNRFELVDNLFGRGHIKKIHDSAVLFFTKGNMIGFLGFRPDSKTKRSILTFTVIVCEPNH